MSLEDAQMLLSTVKSVPCFKTIISTQQAVLPIIPTHYQNHLFARAVVDLVTNQIWFGLYGLYTTSPYYRIMLAHSNASYFSEQPQALRGKEAMPL